MDKGTRAQETHVKIQPLLLLLFALAAVGCRSAEAQTQPDQPPEMSPPDANAIRVELAVVQPSKASLELELPGEVEGSRDASLAAPMGGYIEQVLVSPGDHARRGQTLVAVDTVAQAARRDQARVELEAAKREYERYRRLGDAIARVELDAAETRLKAARAAVKTASVMVTRSIVTAPFEGVVVTVDAEVGEVAAPGSPLVRLVQLDPAKVTVSLSERDVVSLQEGMAARVSLPASAGVALPGKVEHIQRAADLKTRTFIAEIEVQNDDERLLPGMIATVRLAPEAGAERLVIRQDWLVTRGSEVGVFVAESNTARWRPVELGPVTRNQVVVRRGLEAGDALVVTGHRQLADGDPLLVARRGTCCNDGRVAFE
jgi:membrane fusion protein (multidrug efflux system)